MKMEGHGMIFWLTVFTFTIFFKVSKEENKGCLEQSLVGKESLNISDENYSASSIFDYRYPPHQAKLYGPYGWSPKYNNNPDDYLQIDLGTPRVITAVATQGNGGDPNDQDHKIKDEWVKTYNLSLSNNTKTWIRYKRTINGNTDSYTVIRYDFQPPITAQFIRFIPLTYDIHKTMRVNVYVFNKSQEAPRVTVLPSKRSILLNWTITPCRLLTITGYKVKLNGKKIFNTGRIETKYWLKDLKPYTEYRVSVKAQIQQGDGLWSKVISTRTEMESCPEYSLVGNKRTVNIPDSSYTASSYYGSMDDVRYAPYNAKINNSHGWAARNNDNPDDYLQIDLGTPRVITAVATQGNGDREEWVTKYQIILANVRKWTTYKQNIKLRSVFAQMQFVGNTDKTTLVRHDLENPITARYIRFIPLEFHTWKTMRVNVYVSIQEAPRFTLVHPGKRSMKLTWSVKPCSPTQFIKGYEVRLATKTGTYHVNSSGMTCNVTNLKPYTEYNVSVRAIKEVGYGVWSNVTTTRTAIAGKVNSSYAGFTGKQLYSSGSGGVSLDKGKTDLFQFSFSSSGLCISL